MMHDLHRIGLCAAVAALSWLGAQPAQAVVYDDVAAWYHLDGAAAGAVGSPDDIRDQRLWGSNTGFKATSLQGSPAWTSGLPANGPAGGQGYGGRGLSLTPAAGAPDGFDVSNLALAGDATFLTRFRWDGHATSEPTAQMYLNGFNFGANQGWLARLVGGGGAPQVFFGNGANQITSSWTTTPGTWYDMAITVQENGASDTVTFHRWADGGAYQTQSQTGDFFSGAVDAAAGSKVGYESLGGNANKAFNGAIDHLAVWNRALSTNEVQRAFGAPQPGFTIGINNGTTDDMRLEGQVDANYTLGEPWHEFRRAVSTGGDTATVNFNLTAQQAALPYYFHADIVGTQAGNPGTIRLVVNGTPLSTMSVMPGSQPEWSIPPALLQTGANSVSIERVGGPSAFVAWDFVEMAGSWQLGLDNNSQGEFTPESNAPDDFYVTNPNWGQLERAITAGDPAINLHFELSEQMADHNFLYTFEVNGPNPSSGVPFSVMINGSLLASIPASPTGTVFNLDVPYNRVFAGANVLSIEWVGPGSWTQFDYHRLTIGELGVPEPTTAMASAMALAALAARRRRR